MVFIKGIGCVNALGNDINHVWSMLSENNSQSKFDCKYPFLSYLRGSEKRRYSRQSDITLYTLEKAKEDYFEKTEKPKLDNKVGTIFSSNLGSIDVNIQFGEQVYDGEPGLCSPILFSNTVANAPLTSVCLKNNYQGVSTMMMDSNEIIYSFDLIHEKKAKDIFCGFIEEYNKDLFDSYKAYYRKSKLQFAESVTTFLIGEKQSKHESYCKIVALEEVNLLCDPWDDTEVYQKREEIENIMTVTLQNCLKRAKLEQVDAYILGTENLLLNNYEVEVILRNDNKSNIVTGIKELFGDTGSGSFDINLLVGSLCIKHGIIPRCLLASNKGEIYSILISGISRTGNYYLAVLSK